MNIPYLRRRAAYSVVAVVWALAGCTSPSSPRVGSSTSSATQTYDVIVVGAGLSGLTTAKDLIRVGRKVLVLEATDKIGGRAVTDSSFDVPIDLGAAWLHGADSNPLTSAVDWANYHRAPSRLAGPVFIGSHRLIGTEAEAFARAFAATEHRMEEASRQGRDEAVATFLPSEPDFRALIGGNIGPLESGAEATHTSSADSAAFQADPDDFVREGVGTFVADFGRSVPVQLNSPVIAIRYGSQTGDGVEVETASHTIYHGRRVVVTVSTGVLAAHRIAFQPDLPAWKWDAIHQLPMGLLNKVVFQFNGPILPAEHASEWVLYLKPDASSREVMAFVVKPLGANIIVGFYGATQARTFEARGDRAAIDYAKAALATMYGAQLVSQVRDSATKVTHWGANEWTLGAYSAALPGASKMHAEMARPVADRVFFAGEACGPVEFNGSLPSAYISGLQASRAVEQSLAPADHEVIDVPARVH
jgi:monoamine oxidase